MRPPPVPRRCHGWCCTHARMETRLLLRNGEQLLLALVIPLLLLVGGAESDGRASTLGPGAASTSSRLA